MESSFMNFVPTMDWSCQQRYMVVKVSMTLTTQVKLHIFRQFLWGIPVLKRNLHNRHSQKGQEKKPLESHHNEAKEGQKGLEIEGRYDRCKVERQARRLNDIQRYIQKMATVTNQRGNEKQKPSMVKDYNDSMSSIDRSDQMLSYHSDLRKTLRWY